MERYKVYIGLGSNLGDRLGHLQESLYSIFNGIGAVTAVSSVYQTASVGFAGPDFLNACCRVETFLQPVEVLTKLNEIEAKLGRVKTLTRGYASRPIDLDILLFEDQVIATAQLTVPHPRLHQRRFVLEPLNEIAEEVKHPTFKKSISNLRVDCTDHSNTKRTQQVLSLPHTMFAFSQINYLSLEGNIGSGKTSLASLIAAEFNGRLVLERFADNPFLPKFYNDPERYAFTLEMSFLADRYQQITDDLSQLNLFKDFVVSDYYVYKSLIFSKITLPVEEFKLYRTLFYQMYKELPRPDLYIYLYQNTKRLKANIEKRGRSYEQEISEAYLDKIQKGYLDFLRNQSDLKVEIIDISDRDFIAKREDLVWILNTIEDGCKV